jgi:hypothetical protein
MKTVYISNRGDDKNTGSIDKPVYSWKRAKEVQGGNNENTIRFLDPRSGVKERPVGDRCRARRFFLLSTGPKRSMSASLCPSPTRP